MTARTYVWDPWKSACAEPERIAVATDDGASMTYKEMVRDADRVGHALISMGLSAGERISTDLRTGPEFFATALAALKFGFGLFPVDAYHFCSGEAKSLCSRAGTVLHITGEHGVINGPTVTYRELLTQPVKSATAESSVGYLIFATSGTTTGKHDVVVQQRSWRPYGGVAVFERYSAGKGFGPHIMGNPMFHLGTLGPALYALQSGSGVIVSYDWSPKKMNGLIKTYSAASAFLSVDRLTEYALSTQEPSGLSTLFHGGSACAPWVKRQAIAVHGPILHEYYGTSEGVVSEISSAEWLQHPGSVGRPLAGIDIVVSRDGAHVSPGMVGEITVRARRSNGGEERPIRATGDLGYLDSAGYLHVLGRAADAGGTTEALVEHKVRSITGVRDVVAIEESGVTCLVEVEQDRITDLGQTITAVIKDAGVNLCELLILAPNELQRTSSGKLSRVAAKRLVAARSGRSSPGPGLSQFPDGSLASAVSGRTVTPGYLPYLSASGLPEFRVQRVVEELSGVVIGAEAVLLVRVTSHCPASGKIQVGTIGVRAIGRIPREALAPAVD